MRRRQLIMSAIILLFTLSLISAVYLQTPSDVTVAQSSTSVNWNTNGNYGSNWDYVQQNILNSSDVSGLQLSWVLPLPPAPSGYTLNGVSTTPLIENGITYFLTQDSEVFAVNTLNGATIWNFQIPIPLNNESAAISGNPGACHSHNSDLFYSSNLLNQQLVWTLYECGSGYQVYALNAGTGKLVVNYSVPFQNLPGVRGNYAFTGHDAVLDAKRGVLIVGTGSVSEAASMPRGFMIGINVSVNPPSVLWETPIMPPQDGSDPAWDIQSVDSMVGAWIFNGTGAVNLKTLSPSVLNSTLYDDWGFSQYYNGTNSFAGTAAGWGGPWAVNEATGIAYVTTDQPGPDYNATFRPGPNLWSDSVIALNVTSGAPIWAFQTFPHDIEDYDCAWSVMIVNATLANGQTQQEIVKGCKDGYLYALNPQNGALLWYFNPPNILRLNSAVLNPLNSTQMHKRDLCPDSASTCYFNPVGDGGFESDPAYNPLTGLIYVVAYNSEGSIQIVSVPPTPTAQSYVPGVPAYDGNWGATSFGVTGPNDWNATIWALNAANGQPVWHFNLPGYGFRGGTLTTSDLLFVPLINGTIDVLNAKTGALVAQPFTGAGMDTQPALGTAANGQLVLVQPLGAADAFVLGAGITPGITGGTVVALTLKSSTVSTTLTCGTGTTNVNGVCVSNGIGTTLFYGVVAVAAVLAIVATVLGVTRKRSSQKSTTSQ